MAYQRIAGDRSPACVLWIGPDYLPVPRRCRGRWALPWQPARRSAEFPEAPANWRARGPDLPALATYGS